MSIPQVQPIPAINGVETAEMKQPLQYHEVDESLSEWELARLTSKTWSMEQDKFWAALFRCNKRIRIKLTVSPIAANAERNTKKC